MTESLAKLSAIDLHRERARALRLVVLHHWFEMQLKVKTATERTAEVIMLEADIEIYARALREDAELEHLASEKEQV